MFTKKYNRILNIAYAFITLVSVFILPIFAEPIISYILIVVSSVAYIVYKVIKFAIENPKFNFSESKTAVNIAGSIIAILVGLVFGLILMLIVNAGQAFPGFFAIIQGGFRDAKSVGNMIYFSAPLVLTGLSVAFAFRTGLFNIGATGQLTMGAFVAVFIGVKWTFLGELTGNEFANNLIHWGVAVIFAAIAGGIWGAIPGVLKAFRNVNEVVTSIMLNYVAMYLNTWLIKSFIYNVDYARAQDIASSAATPTFGLDNLFPNSSINGSILVAILIVIILHIILNYTTFGYELKAVGFNKDAARYSGMNAKRNIVMSMVISGMVSGVAGALIFLVEGKHLKPENILLAEGFTGIAISLLGLSSPFGVLLAGLFYGSLQQGGYYLQLYDYKPEIIDIIIAVIIYASALALFLQQFVIKSMKRREMLAIQQDVDVEGGEN
jgi:simple sugar transport system permease protein